MTARGLNRFGGGVFVAVAGRALAGLWPVSFTAGEAVEGAGVGVGRMRVRQPAVQLEPVTFKEEPEIRVRIAKGATKKEFSGPSKLIVRPVGAALGKSRMLKGPLAATTGPNGLLLVDGDGAKNVFPFGTDVEVLAS